MAASLTGKKVAFLVGDAGDEPAELTEPWQAVAEAGGTPVRVAVGSVAEADPAGCAGLVVPGPVAETGEGVVAFIRRFFEEGKPVAVIGEGARTLIQADVVRGRTLTSAPSLEAAVLEAGGSWVDQEVAIDAGLVSSCDARDLRTFCRALVDELAAGDDAGLAAHRPTGTG